MKYVVTDHKKKIQQYITVSTVTIFNLIQSVVT